MTAGHDVTVYIRNREKLVGHWADSDLPEPEIIVPSPGDAEVPDIELTDTGLDPTADVPDAPPPFDNKDDEDMDDTPPFEFVEKMPTPIGGIEGIQKRIAYLWYRRC